MKASRTAVSTLAVALLLFLTGSGIGQTASLAGQLLVASESMSDPRFRESVIYMVRHDETGALGLIVNRPVTMIPVADFLRDLGRDGGGMRGTIRIHYGGPVAPSLGFVLHTPEWKGRETRMVGDGIALTTAMEIVEAIGHGTGPRRALVVLGYAGWRARQLEAEIAADAWVSVTADESVLFDDDATTKWKRAMARRKITL
jgi:putative transcriptional regulator